MATNIETDPTPAPPSEEDCSEGLCLNELIEKIAGLEENPTFEDLQGWLARVRVSGEELEPYVKFRPGTYVRTRVIRNSHVEMLVLCWRPGHYTSIHDHNGSYSSIRVLSGEMHETLYDYDGERGLCETGSRAWPPGHVAVADIPDIHRIGNREGGDRPLVTLHCYSPPFDVINTYQPGSREIGEQRPEEPRVVATTPR
ncbi:MAG TPA: cysteine dioxygenase family protein [Pyrinomonadaceae bacterium]|jgi:cysteine dioxygenase|nr:cysteine dioxygenase family protein [Pyrinomonadaceae bacterium]